MSLTTVFNRGLDGLTVSQRGLAVAANNIANVNTPGYARQKLLVGPRATDENNIVFGGGAEVLGVDNITNSFVEMQLFSSVNAYGTLEGRQGTMTQIEELFNESQNSGLGQSMNDFFNSFSGLANNAASIPLRQGVKDKAGALAQKFNALSSTLSQMKRDLSSEITTRVSSVNALSSQIATLNQQIVQAGGVNKAQDLVVQRTYALKQLSEEVNVSYFTETSGAVQVQLGSGGSLVNGFAAGTISVASDSLGSGGQIALNLTFAGSTSSFDVTNQITSGKLGGNLLDRNTTLNTQISNLDNLAYQMSTQFNAVYTNGYGLDGSTGNNFFTPLSSATGAAAAMAVDSSVTGDVRTIAAATASPTGGSSGVADGRNAQALVALQDAISMKANPSDSAASETFGQYYQGLVGSIGVASGSIKRDYDTQGGLVNQLQVQRESVSGVNMDEEGANIIQYQKAFEAASRLMSMANEMLDSLFKI